MADLQTQVNDLTTQLATVTSNLQQLSQAHDALVQQLDQLKQQLTSSIGTNTIQANTLHVTGGSNLDGDLTVGGTINGTLPSGIIGEPQLKDGSVDGRVIASGVVSESHMDASARSKLDGAFPAQGGVISSATVSDVMSFEITPTPPSLVAENAKIFANFDGSFAYSLNIQGPVLSPSVPFSAGAYSAVIIQSSLRCKELIADTITTSNFSQHAPKTFRIAHPLRPHDSELVHSCLEGPEVGVYYRGDGRLHNGLAEIILPDYFEALTRIEGRTILLSPVDEGHECNSMLSASRIVDGRFTVRTITGGNPSQAFCWEVKAIRADVELLEVEPPKVVVNHGRGHFDLRA